MKVILDGKKEAEKVAVFLEDSEKVLGKSLIIFQCDGHTEDSQYVRLKREMGERLGVLVSVVYAKNKEELVDLIKEANEDESVDGILVQLPIIGANKEETERILTSIKIEKDVDGLNSNSSFIPAVVGAVERVLDIFYVNKDQKIAVVGAGGFVGKGLVDRLIKLGFEVAGFEIGDDLMKLSEFEIVISATGEAGLITGEMVRDRLVAIDLGYPKGDFSREALEKASMISPVPGGVGPLTVVCLYESLAKTYS